MSNKKMKSLEIICPITQSPIKDPVSTPGGHTYEKNAILKWLENHSTSPLTNSKLSLEQVVPNYALRDLLNNDNNNNNNNINDDELIIEAHKLDIFINNYNNIKTISIIPPDVNGVPCAVSLVIDIPGSMSTAVKVKKADGQEECHGLTQLDIVKHSAKTIIKSLRSYDELSIISYSDSAKVVLPLQLMNKYGKKLAIDSIDSLQTEGMTNIYDGLIKGLEQVNQSDNNRCVMLLTDGLPNRNPPSGIINALKRYKDKTNYDATISTFGFGYSLDSKLLEDIAHDNQGSYSFIPDGTMVGTVFINAVSNLMTTVAKNCIINIENDDTNNIKILGNCLTTQQNWGKSIIIGNIRGGQSQTIAFTDHVPSTISVTYHNFVQEINVSQNELCVDNVPPTISIQFEISRLLSCDVMMQALQLADKKDYKGAMNILKDMANNVENENLKGDLLGQATEAVSKKSWYNRWGKHYLYSLIGAHQSQQCNNFKDGVTIYGGTYFKKYLEDCEDIFLSIDPPKPSIRAYQNHVVSSSAFSGYYDRDGACVCKDTLIKMMDGSFKLIQNLKKGDLISSINETTYDRVKCVIKTTNYSGAIVELNTSCKITPWHPVLHNDEWQFPAILSNKIYKHHGIEVYNLVLEKYHIAIVNNDTPIVTLGHNFKGPVIEHEYFGTEKVINDLKKCVGWSTGEIIINSSQIKRNKNNGLVTQII